MVPGVMNREPASLPEWRPDSEEFSDQAVAASELHRSPWSDGCGTVGDSSRRTGESFTGCGRDSFLRGPLGTIPTRW